MNITYSRTLYFSLLLLLIIFIYYKYGVKYWVELQRMKAFKVDLFDPYHFRSYLLEERTFKDCFPINYFPDLSIHCHFYFGNQDYDYYDYYYINFVNSPNHYFNYSCTSCYSSFHSYFD